MRILAIESADMAAAVALLDGDRLIVERKLTAADRSARALAPAIEAALAEAGWQPSAIELIAVTAGPGSFTSLRVGLATAKSMAYALSCAIIGVPTLEALARTVAATSDESSANAGPLCMAIDAQRQQVFAARFERAADGSMRALADVELLDNDAWLASLPTGAIVAGSALRTLAGQVPSGVHAAPSEVWQPSAAMVGRIGLERFQAGERDDVFQLVPIYLRRTAAEEQWDRKHSAGA